MDPVSKILGDDDEYGMRRARPSSQPLVCKKCGAQFYSKGELFEHKTYCK